MQDDIVPWLNLYDRQDGTNLFLTVIFFVLCEKWNSFYIILLKKLLVSIHFFFFKLELNMLLIF